MKRNPDAWAVCLTPLQPWMEPRKIYAKSIKAIPPERRELLLIQTGFNAELDDNHKAPFDFSDRNVCWEWTQNERQITAAAPVAKTVEELSDHVSSYTNYANCL